MTTNILGVTQFPGYSSSPVKGPFVVMPDLIRHPEASEFTGFPPSRE